MDWLIGLAGAALLGITLLDVFVTVALPRAAKHWRVSRYVWRALWAFVHASVQRIRSPATRETVLGVYGPFSIFVVLTIWIALLILAFGAIVYATRSQISPRPGGFDDALYLGGTALLTIGYANGAGTSLLGKAIGLVAGATGLTLFALVITFLFSLFASFRERELEVVSLEASAGAPPSGVAFLEFYARAGMRHEIGPAFERWQRWAAAILDSHLAYPILAYFRSSHDHDSWVSSLGAIMDAAALVLTTVQDGPIGAAKMAWWVGGHCIDDLADYFSLQRPHMVGVELSDFRVARDRLEGAGWRLRPEAESWEQFAKMRSEHAAALNALAEYWASPPAVWIREQSLRFQHAPARPLD